MAHVAVWEAVILIVCILGAAIVIAACILYHLYKREQLRRQSLVLPTQGEAESRPARRFGIHRGNVVDLRTAPLENIRSLGRRLDPDLHSIRRLRWLLSKTSLTTNRPNSPNKAARPPSTIERYVPSPLPPVPTYQADTKEPLSFVSLAPPSANRLSVATTPAGLGRRVETEGASMQERRWSDGSGQHRYQYLVPKHPDLWAQNGVLPTIGEDPASSTVSLEPTSFSHAGARDGSKLEMSEKRNADESLADPVKCPVCWKEHCVNSLHWQARTSQNVSPGLPSFSTLTSPIALRRFSLPPTVKTATGAPNRQSEPFVASLAPHMPVGTGLNRDLTPFSSRHLYDSDANTDEAQTQAGAGTITDATAVIPPYRSSSLPVDQSQSLGSRLSNGSTTPARDLNAIDDMSDKRSERTSIAGTETNTDGDSESLFSTATSATHARAEIAMAVAVPLPASSQSGISSDSTSPASSIISPVEMRIVRTASFNARVRPSIVDVVASVPVSPVSLPSPLSPHSSFKSRFRPTRMQLPFQPYRVLNQPVDDHGTGNAVVEEEAEDKEEEEAGGTGDGIEVLPASSYSPVPTSPTTVQPHVLSPMQDMDEDDLDRASRQDQDSDDDDIVTGVIEGGNATSAPTTPHTSAPASGLLPPRASFRLQRESDDEIRGRIEHDTTRIFWARRERN